MKQLLINKPVLSLSGEASLGEFMGALIFCIGEDVPVFVLASISPDGTSTGSGMPLTGDCCLAGVEAGA